jgi:serine/threonine protein kinase
VKALEAGDPQLIGKYRLLGRLGSGGMGRVFLGQSPGGRLVAVKLIRPDLAAYDDFRGRFSQEVRAARKVSGIFTAPVVDADPDGPRPWLVTAYVPGPSLADAVAAKGPLPVSSVLMLAAGLAEGLNAIHAAGVVHRDLKPSNVILASDGPRIIDFGISWAADATALTGAGMLIGSPGFMSPEQAGGHKVGPPSDVFSLGSVLTFAAAGKGPFGSGPGTALLYRVVHAEPATDRVPVQIRPLVEQCLAKDPLHRPTTDQILAELGSPQLAAGWLPASIGQILQDHQRPDLVAPDDAEFRAPQMRAEPAAKSSAASDDTMTHPTRRGPAPDAAISPGQTPDTRQLRHRWPGQLSRARTAGTLAAAAVLALVLAFIFLRSTPPNRASASASSAVLGPGRVVEAFYAAINDHNWPRVWQLGGKNLGTPYQAMIAGYRMTARDVITSLSTSGAVVTGHILAHQTSGTVQDYRISFLVHSGVITAGHQTLLAVTHPSAG